MTSEEQMLVIYLILIFSPLIIPIVVGISFYLFEIPRRKARSYIMKVKKEWLTLIGEEYQTRIKQDKYTYKCSLSIASKAEEKPYEYVYKYFYKDATPSERFSIQQYIREEQKERKNLYQRACEIKTQIVHEHGLDRLIIWGRTIKDLLGVSDYWLIQPPPEPAFVFLYTSPQKRNKKETRVECTPQLGIFLGLKDFEKPNAQRERSLMTPRLRNKILARDNYTCQNCGLSTRDEPHLLLEVDHIIPISKGGKTTEDNLQTLCWKCNRTKSNKIINHEIYQN